MPAISVADLARLRDCRQWSKPYLVVHKPNTMLTGTINDYDIEQGERNIVFDNGGACPGYAPNIFFEENTTLWVGTTPGNRDAGIVRVRDIIGTWPYNSGAIKVTENSDIQWANDLYLTMKDEHRIWPRFPRVRVDEPSPTGTAEITWWKDYDIEYTDQNIEEPPVVIMGSPAVTWLGQSVLFFGEDSYSPRGTAFSTFLWTFPHGTPATANTLGTRVGPHVVNWALPGVHMVRLAITDNNGNTSYGYRPVFVFEGEGGLYPDDDLYPDPSLYPDAGDILNSVIYQDFEIRSMGGDFSLGGWTTTFRVFENAKVEDFPEGTMVVVAADDWYGGARQGIGGYKYRENIVFVGWITANSVRKEPTTGEITFEAHTVDGELRNCPSFPISLNRVITTPIDWGEIYYMDLDLAAFHLGYWHSTLYEVSDVLESGDDRAVKYMDIPEDNIYQQLDRTIWTDTILARALSDRQSRFKYDCNPQFLDDADRNALPTIMTIQDEDWLGVVDIEEIQEPQTSWLDASGVYVSPWEKTYPLYSLAPGEAPKPDGSFKQLPRLLVSNQADIDRITGFALANDNKMHPDRTRGLSSVGVPFQGNYRIFDLHPQEWVSFPNLDTLREGREPWTNEGTPWPSGTRFIPRNVDLEFDNNFGCFMTTVGLEPETYGPLGQSVIYPGQPGSGGKVAILQETVASPTGTVPTCDTVLISENLFADSPTWARRHNGLPWYPLPGNHSFYAGAFKIDPLVNGFNGLPITALLGVQSEASAIHPLGVYSLIYRNADIRLDTPWVDTLSCTNVRTQVYGGAGTFTEAQCPDIVFDSKTDGWAYAIIYVTHSVQGSELLGFRSINHGLTWTFVANISAQLSGAAPHSDYARPECLAIVDPYDSNYLYMKARLGAANWYWIRSIDKGVTWTKRLGGAGVNSIVLQPQQNSDDAYYDAGGEGWSLGFYSQCGRDIGAQNYSFAVRFPSAGIPQGTSISSASLAIKAFTSGQLNGAITIRITGLKECFLPTFTTRGAFDSWGRTAAFVDWSPPNFTPGVTYNTPSITAIIQELVNQAGWTPSCAMGLEFELTAAAIGRMRVAYNYENGPADTPKLNVTYALASETEFPSRPVVLDPKHNRDKLASYWGQVPPTSYRTVDGWATKYGWYQLTAGDGPVSMVTPIEAHTPIVCLTYLKGTAPGYTSYLHVSYDGETFSDVYLLPVSIAQTFNVWPWMIEGAPLMYVATRTGDLSTPPLTHSPLTFWISEDGGETWQEKTGNLNTLLDGLGVGRDRTNRIEPLEKNII